MKEQLTGWQEEHIRLQEEYVAALKRELVAQKAGVVALDNLKATLEDEK